MEERPGVTRVAHPVSQGTVTVLYYMSEDWIFPAAK